MVMVTTHVLHLTSLWSNHFHHSKSLTAPSDVLHLIFGTSFLHITHNSSSELLIPLSATFIWKFQFNLLHTAITFSLFHSELKTYTFSENLHYCSKNCEYSAKLDFSQVWRQNNEVSVKIIVILDKKMFIDYKLNWQFGSLVLYD